MGSYPFYWISWYIVNPSIGFSGKHCRPFHSASAGWERLSGCILGSHCHFVGTHWNRKVISGFQYISPWTLERPAVNLQVSWSCFPIDLLMAKAMFCPWSDSYLSAQPWRPQPPRSRLPYPGARSFWPSPPGCFLVLGGAAWAVRSILQKI